MYGLLQPLDCYINKPLKDHVRAIFNDQFIQSVTNKENLTPKGYIKPPKTELIVDWILTCCEKISETLIKKSFKHCWINNNMLDSENDLINP